MSAASKGRYYEHRSIALLERLGYYCMRSARSGGLWDIVGVRRDGVVLVQVKAASWPSVAERLELAEFEAPANCRKEVHRWRRRARLPDIIEL